VNRVFVTGMGAISAIGHNVAGHRTSLIAGKCGIGFQSGLASRYAGHIPFGSVDLTTDELKTLLDAHDNGLTRTTLLALYAFCEAARDAHLDVQLGDAGTALIGATTVGGMCLTDELYRDSNGGGEGSPFLASYDGASVYQYLVDRYGIGGIVTTINTACSSSANAIQYGGRLIRSGLASRAIAGGVDSLAKYTVNGFKALQILAPEPCRPFDEQRKGLNLGEAAAFLVLESEEVVQGKPIYAELTGYCNVNDAYHPSALSPDGEGPYLAMQGAMQDARLDPREIGYINAHGTGTENNDVAESRALLRVFGEPPAFASTKSATGHTLGASGALEAVFSVLGLVHQEFYPQPNFSSPMPETGLRPVTAYSRAPLRHVLSNSFGFGGNCTSLVFSKV
jgi:3-oxoacyl-(acyl-carrier-protein) synthase